MPGPEYLADLDPTLEPGAMVLARVRQLSAHEVGHTLGFAHNFAASARGRNSVMDYPAPLVKIENGMLDLSGAYAKGIGAYDRFATKYAYASFSKDADDAKGLAAIIREGIADGLLFVSDADARPAGSAHPLAALWDNGDDPVVMLAHEMNVRRLGLEAFGLGRIAEGAPLSDLEAKLLPLYLHHRYQLVAAIKSIGGVSYSYAVRDGAKASPEAVMTRVPADRQRTALSVVLDTLKPETLVIPARILDLIPPRAYGRPSGTAELFEKSTGTLFDPIAAATIAADIAVSGLLQHERAARLNAFHSRDANYPDFAEVVAKLVDRTWQAPPDRPGPARAIARAEQILVVHRLFELGENDSANHEVRAAASEALERLANIAIPRPGDVGEGDREHQNAIRQEILRFIRRPEPASRRTPTTPAPPGDPIGAAGR